MVIVLGNKLKQIKLKSEPQIRNTCTENNTMIVSERISPNLSETPIREIVAHVIDNGAHCDTSREDDNNTNRQMPEVNVTLSSDKSKYNEQE